MWGAGPAEQRPYQHRTIAWFKAKRGRGMLIADTGAGKTYISLKATSELGYTRLVVLARKYLNMLAWRTNIAKFRSELGLPDDADILFIESWTPKKRKALWETAPERPQIVVMLYASMVRDRALIDHPRACVTGFVADEGHILSDRRNKASKALKYLARDPKRYLMVLTATPMERGRQDMFSVLSMLSPKVFSSYWGFVERYCVSIPGLHGNEIIGNRKSTTKEYLERTSGFVHAISNSELKGFIPERVRSKLPIPMLKGKELKAYNDILNDAVARLPTNGVVAMPNILTATLRLRQMLVCPKLIDPSFGYGNGITETLEHARDENKYPHIVIFSEFVSAFPFMREELTTVHKIKDNNIRLVVGQKDIIETQRQIDDFHEMHSWKQPSVLLCGIQVAESFDLITPQNAYFIGYAWSRRQNYQAEGRLTRGQKTHCNYYYVTHEGSVEENVLHSLNTNNRNVRELDAKELRRALLAPREALL